MRALLVVVMAAVPKLALAQGTAPAGGAPAPPPDPSTMPPQPIAQQQPYAQQPMPAPMIYTPPPRERHGLFGGGGLFGGNISCDGADCGGFREAGGASGHIGYLFTTKLGVLLDLWAMTSSQNNVSVTFVASTINLRYYVAPSFWVQGGIGNGHAIVRVSIFQARGDDVPAAEVGAGLELVRGRNWALDVSLKLAQGGKTDQGMDMSDDVQTGRMVGLGAHITLFGTRPVRGASY